MTSALRERATSMRQAVDMPPKDPIIGWLLAVCLQKVRKLGSLAVSKREVLVAAE